MKYLELATPLTKFTQAGYGANVEGAELIHEITYNRKTYKFYKKEDDTKYLEGNGETLILTQDDFTFLLLHYVFSKEDFETLGETLEDFTERRTLLYYVNMFTEYATVAEYEAYANDFERGDIERIRQEEA